MGVQFIENTIIVVFGASGDLAKKKTFPALFGLFREGQLSETTKIIGFARSKLSNDDLRNRIKPYLKLNKRTDAERQSLEKFLQILEYHQSNYDDSEGFEKLEKLINKYDDEANVKESHRLYYLALPPSVFTTVATMLKKHCHPGDSGIARLIVEKPFGHDLSSSRELQKSLAPLWNEDELFRIDHYLGKEMVKNLIPLRFSNTFLSSSWNNQFIDTIQITFKENFGTMDVQFVVLSGREFMVVALNNGSIDFYEFKDSLFKLESKKIKDIDGATLENLPKPTYSLQGHASRVKGISFYKEIINGKLHEYMVSISSDGKIVVWNLDLAVMDQVAVYSTGERLNVVSTVQETIEKASTMKPIYNPDDKYKDVATDSEYESDGESLAHIMKGGKRVSKKKQRKEKKKLLSVEIE